MMKIRYFSEHNLATLKSNLSTMKANIDFRKKPFLGEILDAESYLIDSNIETENINLVMGDLSKTETDIQNIKILHSSLKELSESKASDERMWVALALTDFFDYMTWRWPIKSVNDLENRYFFGYSKQRSLTRHGIARLWWIGHMTYDDNRKNPYELTEFVAENSDYIPTIFERNISNNPKVMKALIDSLIKSRREGINISRKLVRDIIKYLNNLSGVYLIDIFTYEELSEKVIREILRLNKARGYNEAIDKESIS